MTRILTLLFLLINTLSFGQVIVVNDSVKDVSLNQEKWHFKDNLNYSDPRQIPENSWEYFPKPPNFAFNRSVHWFKYEIFNSSDKDLDRIIYIPYNHIRSISIFVKSDNQFYLSEKLGSKYSKHRSEFNSQAHSKRIKLKSKSKTTIFIKFDHKFLPLRASVFLLSSDVSQETIKRSNSILWAWKGSYIFASIIAFILFFYHRSRLFIDYFMFNTGVAIFVVSHTGLYFLFKDYDSNEYLISIVFFGTSIVGYFGPKFINGISEFKSKLPNLWKFTNYLGITMWVFFFATLIPFIKFSIVGLIINSSYMLFTALIFFSVIYALIKNVINNVSRTWVALLIYSTYVFVTFLDVFLPNLGIIGDSKYIYNTLLISSFFETATFLLLMMYSSFAVLKDRRSLLIRQKENQEVLMNSILSTRKHEREVVGRDLEDLRDNDLTELVNYLDDSPDLKKIADETKLLLEKVSQGMVKSSYSSASFKERMEHIFKISSSSKLKIESEFSNWSTEFSQEVIYNLSSVCQELVSNLIKHTNSTKANFYFSSDDSESIVLKYSNNGQGFNVTKSIRKGIGLRNIISRIKDLSGEIEIISSEKRVGIEVLIKIPVKN